MGEDQHDYFFMPLIKLFEDLYFRGFFLIYEKKFGGITCQSKVFKPKD